MATKKKITVNAKNYALFEYDQYLDRRDNVIPKPAKLTYDIGDVVYIKAEKAIGVVLGCVSEDTEEVRTDMSGMVSFSQIRPATLKDFNSKVHFIPKLLTEIESLAK